jgi:hypothetical protein
VAVQRPIPGPGAFSGHRVMQADRGQLTLSGPGITVVKEIDAGTTPAQRAGTYAPAPAKLDHYGWRQYCHGLFQIPVAA